MKNVIRTLRRNMQNYTEIVHRLALLCARASVHMDLRARGFKLAIKLNCTMAQYVWNKKVHTSTNYKY